MMIDLSTCSHADHDKFVYKYLSSTATIDRVKGAFDTQMGLLRDTKPSLHNYVNDLSLATAEDPRVHQLAKYILLTQFSEEWSTMFEAAFSLLKGILGILKQKRPETTHFKGQWRFVFPPKWSQEIFRLECCLSPNDLHGVIFGIDPISMDKASAYLATGFAFSFAGDDDDFALAGLNDAGKLNTVYGVKEDLHFERASDLEINFIKKYGIGVVNFIRTIIAGSKAGAENCFVDVWIDYNKQWLSYMQEEKWGNMTDRVAIFQNEQFVFDNYSNSAAFDAIKRLLEPASRCVHPSHISTETGLPDSVLPSIDPIARADLEAKTRIIDNRRNESVVAFTTFLNNRGASEALSSLCSSVPKAPATKALAADI